MFLKNYQLFLRDYWQHVKFAAHQFWKSSIYIVYPTFAEAMLHKKVLHAQICGCLRLWRKACVPLKHVEQHANMLQVVAVNSTRDELWQGFTAKSRLAPAFRGNFKQTC